MYTLLKKVCYLYLLLAQSVTKCIVQCHASNRLHYSIYGVVCFRLISTMTTQYASLSISFWICFVFRHYCIQTSLMFPHFKKEKMLQYWHSMSPAYKRENVPAVLKKGTRSLLTQIPLLNLCWMICLYCFQKMLQYCHMVSRIDGRDSHRCKQNENEVW